MGVPPRKPCGRSPPRSVVKHQPCHAGRARLGLLLRGDLEAGQHGERVVEGRAARFGALLGRRGRERRPSAGRRDGRSGRGRSAVSGGRARPGRGRSGRAARRSGRAGAPGAGGAVGRGPRAPASGRRVGRGLSRRARLPLGRRRPHGERDLLLLEVDLEHPHLHAVARLQRPPAAPSRTSRRAARRGRGRRGGRRCPRRRRSSSRW